MINPLRQFVSFALTFSLLSANGFYFAPLLKKLQGNKESASMQNCCCCCNSGGGMPSSCCCASRHSGGKDRTTCSLSSAPCAAPVAVLSPNVLDQGIEPCPATNDVVRVPVWGKFSEAIGSPLPGKVYSLFHPPQYSFSNLFLS